MEPIWRLRCLGQPCLVRHDGGPGLALGRKDAGLLAYVAAAEPGPSLRAALMLWPEAGERGALNNLRQRLHRLRRASGARLLEVSQAAALATDLHPEPPPALELDPEAWDGDWLGAYEYDDCPDFAAWLQQQRLRWAALRREALARLAAEAEAEARLVPALRLAQRLLQEEPLSEHAHRRLMRLHYLRGDVAAAVAAFEHCERLLRDELGLRPSAETQALLRDVERSRLPQPAAPRHSAVTLRRPPRAVGREAAQQALAAALAAGQPALVLGEAGLGKTRLLQDYLAGESALPGLIYLQARPGDRGTPYALAARLLQALTQRWPGLAQLPGRPALSLLAGALPAGRADHAGEAPLRLVPAVEQLLVEAGQAGLSGLLVDDLHFADPASLELLRQLIDAPALAALRWGLAQRPAAAGEPEAELLRQLGDQGELAPLCRIVLAPLDEEQLRSLLGLLALPGLDAERLAPALLRHTGGNPLFLLETLRAMPQGEGALLPRPPGIAQLVELRLQRLSAAALDLARVAALAGPDFGPALAGRVLDRPAMQLAGPWAELESADVLRGNGFAHDLVHEAVLRAIPAPIAAHGHGLIAAWLEGEGAADARIAAHWQAAGAHRQAARRLEQAAAHARQASRPREQAELLQRAAEAWEAAQDAPAAALARARALRPMLRGQGLSAALALAEELAAETGAEPLGARAEVMLWAGRFAEGEALARRALAAASPSQEALSLGAACTAAQCAGLQGRADEGLSLLAVWEERVLRSEDGESRIDFCGACENLMIQTDRPQDMLRWSRLHLEEARRIGDQAEEMTALMNLAAHAMRRGDLADGVAQARAVAALPAADEQARALLTWNDAGLGLMLCAQGLYGEGLGLLERMHAQTEGAATALRATIEQWLATVLLHLGQVARASQLLGDDASLPPGLPRHKRLLVRAALARALGQDPRELLAQALALADRPSSRYEHLQARIELAALDPAALPALEELAEQCARRGYTGLQQQAWLARLNGLLAAAQPAAAAAAAAALADRLERSLATHGGAQAFRPEYLLACARAQGAAGRAEARERLLAEAWHWVRALALPQLPPAWREGLLQRNPHLLSLQAQTARGGGP